MLCPAGIAQFAYNVYSILLLTQAQCDIVQKGNAAKRYDNT